ncbi:MAG: hypothetical protein ACRD0Q_10020 [Acidimicrobiales bacterium]
MTFSAEERAARRSVRLLGTGVLMAAVGAVVFATFRLVDDGPDRSRSPRVSALGPVAPDGEYRQIGPLPGDDVAAYIEDRRAQLSEGDEERVAVVSLRSYTTEAEARAAVGATPVLGLLVAAPGGTAATVTGTLTDWAAQQRQADTSDRDEIRKMLPTVSNPVDKADLQSEVVRLDKAIAAVDPTGDVVFGIVVKSKKTGLRTVAMGVEVRVVDVASTSKPAKTVDYVGIRPEETTKIGKPATRPF